MKTALAPKPARFFSNGFDFTRDEFKNFRKMVSGARAKQNNNGQLGHLYKIGDWKTAESWQMLKVYWPQSYRVTDIQGYPVYG